MIFERIYLGCLAQASYLIACPRSRVAAIVDPRRDVDDYIALAEKKGVEIRHVILTHFHADFVSGHIELQKRCKAKIHVGARAKAEYAFTPAREGSTIELGPTVRLGFLETPGHTPESVCVLVYDRAKSEEKPHAVLTGDTLFIGDVGRPDLMASVGLSAEKLAGMLYDSLHEKLLALPDETLVYPGHGAGSLCGKNLSDEASSTIGTQRKLNYALRPMTKAAFVKLMTSDLAAAPSYFAYDADLNRKKRKTLDTTLARATKPLSLEKALALQAKGAQVLDARSADEYAKGHLVGSINVGLGGKFATWAGALLDREKPIVVIAPAGKESEAVMRLGRIGLDAVAGYLEGGAKAFEARPELVRTHERLTAKQLAKELESENPPHVLDVRAPGEWTAGRIAGNVHVPLLQLEERLADIPRGGRLVIHCAGGYRSMIAASLLARHGIESSDLVGGFGAWEEAKLPVVKGAPRAKGKTKPKSKTKKVRAARASR